MLNKRVALACQEPPLSIPSRTTVDAFQRCIQHNRSTSFDGVQDHFSEQVVLLPNSLGHYFKRPWLPLTKESDAVPLVMHTDVLQNVVEQQANDPSGAVRSMNASDYLAYYSKYQSVLSARSATYNTFLLNNLKKLAALRKTEINQELRSLIHLRYGTGRIRLILLPQHLPKVGPVFDQILAELLEANNEFYLVMLFNPKKRYWRRTLEMRWQQTFPSYAIWKDRVIWLSDLKPDEYLLLLAAGDVMIDPFPFGGGVTMLESLAVCTPIVTCPSLQSVPGLALGMVEEMTKTAAHRKSPATEVLRLMDQVRGSSADYLLATQSLLLNDTIALETRRAICRHHDLLYYDKRSSNDWSDFLIRANKQLVQSA